MLPKPPSIEGDGFKSAKWDELTQGRSFSQADAPALALLCQWYKIADAAQEELDGFGGQTAYGNEMGDLKQFPQIATLKTASAEIRALSKQLGVNDARREDGNAKREPRITVLAPLQDGRAKRRAGAAG